MTAEITLLPKSSSHRGRFVPSATRVVAERYGVSKRSVTKHAAKADWQGRVEEIERKAREGAAIDPSGAVKLTVEPAEEMLTIVEACESSMRFVESLRHRGWDAKTSATRFRLIPPDVLRSELDYLRLELKLEEDGSVSGTLVFDLQEKGIGDYFKAIFNLDQVKRPLYLSSGQIFSDGGEPNYPAISKAIGEVIREVVEQRR